MPEQFFFPRLKINHINVWKNAFILKSGAIANTHLPALLFSLGCALTK
jgi:hypothetical protein